MTQIPDELVEADKNLQSIERMVRQTALKQLLTFCQSGQLTLDLAIAVFNQMYLSLLKGYNDKFEMCRSLSGLVMSALLQKLPDNDYYLDCLIPALARRLGQNEMVEDSEELRLQLLQQLNEIILKFTPNERPATEKSDRFLKTYNDVIDILLRCLRDPFPAARRECCTIIKSYAMATTCFHYRAEVLVQPLLEMLKHHQSPVQVAAIEALGEVMLNIHSNADCIAKVLQALAVITIDPYDTPSVRLGCGRVGCRLLMELRDRYSFFDRILPLVLCCLSDEVSNIREEIEERWTRAGQQFFLENETELAKFEVVETVPVNYPVGYRRPPLGCRALVQRSLKIVNVVLSEMEDWKPAVRLRALQLLHQMVLHTEKAMSKHFVDINIVLCKMTVDQDYNVMKEALHVARLIASLLDYGSWKTVAIEEFRKFMTFGHLKCFRALFAASGETEAKCGDIREICKICLDPSICRSSNPHIMAELLLLCDHLVDLVPHSPEPCPDLIYNILLNVDAFATNKLTSATAELQENIASILKRLTGNNVEAFHDQHMAAMIDEIEGLNSHTSLDSEPIILLCGWIRFAGFRASYMPSMVRALSVALEYGNADAGCKLLTAVSMAALEWRNTMFPTPVNVEDMLQEFLEKIIVPKLVWQAGRSSESLRGSATMVLRALSQGLEPELTQKVVSHHATILTALVEDNEPSTRSDAISTLLHVGPLGLQQLQPLAFGIQSRLDDPRHEIRHMAARCLGRLQLDRATATTADQESWANALKQIVPIMLLHLDAPDVKVKRNIIDSLKMLYCRHRDILKPILDDIPNEYPYKKDVESFENEIPTDEMMKKDE